MNTTYSAEDLTQMTEKIRHLLETRNSQNIAFAWQLIHNLKLNEIIWQLMWEMPLKTHSSESSMTIRGHWDKRFRQVFHRFISRCPPFERNDAAERVTRHLAVMYVIEHKAQEIVNFPPFFRVKIQPNHFGIYASCLIRAEEREYFEKTFLSDRSQKFFQSDFLKFGFQETSSAHHYLFTFKALILRKDLPQPANNFSSIV